jgi:hypothetical protein
MFQSHDNIRWKLHINYMGGGKEKEEKDREREREIIIICKD